MFDAPHSRLLCDILKHAKETPDKIALVDGEQRVSYRQLVERVESASAYLNSQGISRGDYIMLMAQKEPAFVYFYLAAHLLGIINVVVDAASPQERIEYILDLTKPIAVFGNSSNIRSTRAFDDINLDKCKAKTSALPLLKEDDVADVMFTTGTTGASKGVCLTHANIGGSASNTNGFIGTTADDIEALALPLSHSFGLGRLRCVFMAGATLVLVSNFANLKSSSPSLRPSM